MEISGFRFIRRWKSLWIPRLREERQKKRGRAATKRGNSSKDFSGRGRTHVAFIAKINENAVQPEKRADASVQQYVDEILKELEEEGNSGRYKAQRDKITKRQFAK